MVNLVLVLGDQLSENLSALAEADKATDIVVMAEVVSEAVLRSSSSQKNRLHLCRNAEIRGPSARMWMARGLHTA